MLNEGSSVAIVLYISPFVDDCDGQQSLSRKTMLISGLPLWFTSLYSLPCFSALFIFLCPIFPASSSFPPVSLSSLCQMKGMREFILTHSHFFFPLPPPPSPVPPALWSICKTDDRREACGREVRGWHVFYWAAVTVLDFFSFSFFFNIFYGSMPVEEKE